MSWQPEIDEIRRREALAREMGGKDNVERQHRNGRLTVRERISSLLDADSFHEIGALAGRAEYDEAGEVTSFTPSNYVFGAGTVDRRRIVIGGDDFTVRGGAAEAAVGNTMAYSEKLALEWKLPMVRLVDGTGGGGSVKTLEINGRTYIPANPGWRAVVELLGEVPVVAACLGPVAGLGAVRVATSHFSVMVRGVSQLFIAGPPVVERGVGQKLSKEELGGSHIHARGSGVVDNEVATEREAFEAIRRFLSYLPSNVYDSPPRRVCDDSPQRREQELVAIIPRERRRSYDVRRIIELIVDRDSFFEIGPLYGRPLVTGMARLNGFAVGIMANDPRQGGGAVNAAAAEKMIRFIDLCDTFHLPCINFVDNPGFLIGSQAEREGTARIGSRALIAVYQATVPWVSVLLRRVYGVAGAAHGNAEALNFRYAWPSGDWGSLPIQGGVQAAYRREIEAAPDPDRHRRAIEDRLERYRSPLRVAEAFGVEEIIDPRDTRPLLCDWVEIAYGLLTSQLGVKRRKARV